MGVELPNPDDPLPRDVEFELSALMAQAAEKLLGKDQAEAQQEKEQQQQDRRETREAEGDVSEDREQQSVALGPHHERDELELERRGRRVRGAGAAHERVAMSLVGPTRAPNLLNIWGIRFW